LADAADLAGQIARHAWEGHAQEFGRLSPPVTSAGELAEFIDAVMDDPDEERVTRTGKTIYFHRATGTVIVHNPRVPYGGTAVVADEDYFWDVE
jgi:hypothetical protein